LKNFLSPYKAKKLTTKIINSIAFYPAIIAFGFFLLALLAMYVEERYTLYEAIDELPFLAISDADTARSMLSTLAGGIISLMVFTFTMVMLVLNLTSTNYSPRVLPGLVSSKPNQIILGIFLGTIAYTVTVLSNIESHYYSFAVPKVALIINAFAGASCFIGFVYFIHHISRSIQVSNMLVDLHRRTLKVLKHEAEDCTYLAPEALPGCPDGHFLRQKNSGYFQALSEKNLKTLAKQNDLTIYILVTKGTFVLEGDVILKANKPMSEDLKSQISSCFVFQNEELISQNYLMGVKQITEIAVKALSPGINDPGTALQGLNYLTDIFLHLDDLMGHKTIMSEGKIHIVYPATPVCPTIQVSLMEILIYGKGDVVIMHHMRTNLLKLKDKVEGKRVRQCVRDMIDIVEKEITKGGLKPYIKPFLE
jgi:uncharacterized membrane protein